MKHLGSDGDIDLSNTKLLHYAECQKYMQYLGSDGDVNLHIYKPCNHYQEQISLQSSIFLWNNDILICNKEYIEVYPRNHTTDLLKRF